MKALCVCRKFNLEILKTHKKRLKLEKSHKSCTEAFAVRFCRQFVWPHFMAKCAKFTSRSTIIQLKIPFNVSFEPPYPLVGFNWIRFVHIKLLKRKPLIHQMRSFRLDLELWGYSYDVMWAIHSLLPRCIYCEPPRSICFKLNYTQLPSLLQCYCQIDLLKQFAFTVPCGKYLEGKKITQP